MYSCMLKLHFGAIHSFFFFRLLPFGLSQQIIWLHLASIPFSLHVLLHFTHYLLYTLISTLLLCPKMASTFTPPLSSPYGNIFPLAARHIDQQTSTATVVFGLGCSCSHLEMSFLMICIFNLAKIVRVIDLPDTMFSIYLGLGLVMACDGSVAGFCANHPQYPLIVPVSYTGMGCLLIYACRLQVSQAYGAICESMCTLCVLLWSKHQYCELLKAFPKLSKLNSKGNQRSSLGFITMCPVCFNIKRNAESKAQLHFTLS